ncbi:hypothetical protein OG884_15475 [Streptosporangium sp. NBC_01755]|uniref:hypothetical protein n=1 Tax=Streptosporangium sp. NBC_01755 TaxID=2975949 RepID=UPI002DD7D248|nr:hypothetical protein [Streptosporangium sp. NBC_01755]WSD03234.1 hypothetical protein OG884_15475 [Streptosporangium sp. NBC_01755]
MGYKRKKTFKLTFADGDLEGLEVRVRSISIERFLELAPLLDMTMSGGMTPEDIESIREMLDMFASVLVDWNLEDEDDMPVPCTAEALMDQDLRFVTGLMSTWAEHIAGVSAPLERPSPDGEPSLEESLPMEVLSPSPVS